ncbi:MAG: ABC transporter permease [Flavobacteriaceae bacterium CG_4_8_14_3_um_filter_34_10]|nr:ABC transporter permease [Flavobacteriia bacterium]OIP50475.1 MAG: ABC transporter permease [Flavobacteriaceae bacterium CG2_30_34_30]PIQ18214.1 MAG: ABC transporter permease [Flavobacteriaceae bacterium CG18_big_fil_WC_8_21_14_2_50_34_36]PIV49700.1 MAG: ABC transporter permease [Flavobacteriaceae bacterium CG02_land_8_20_14_3_00_34_13]PIX08797.1 MAG: ABC transporter permease [Flavobacteriaceae bacterium CG_4_8_14_3_um_filter_34_10]PIZ09074.1 MAG: ABC transporter permease [Flavobacteriaceae
MLRLLSIELQKLRYNKAAKVISIVYFLLIICIALIASIEFSFGDINFRVADQGIFNFPYIWHFNTWVAALLKLFLAIVIVSMMANEYSHRTLKQNLIDGLSKKEFIISKFITVVGFAVVSTIFVFIVSLILGFSFSDFTEIGIIFSDMQYLLAYFIKLVGFFAFCLFLGVLVKRSAFALGFLLIWFIFENIIIGLLKWKFFKDTNVAETVGQFFPLEAMSNLIKEPFSRLGAVKSAASQLGEGFNKVYDVQWHNLLIVLLWTLFFIYLSYLVLKKRDL